MKNSIISLLILLLVFSSHALAVSAPVEVVIPSVKGIEEIKVISSVTEPYMTTRVAAKTGGVIKELRVEVGQLVQKDDLLLRFDDEQINLQIKQAEAALEIAQANYQLLSKGATAEDLNRAEAAYDQAVSSYEGAKINLELLESIYQDRTVQKQQLLNAELQLEAAQKQAEGAEQRVRQVEISLEQAQNGLEQAEKEFERIQYLYQEQVVTKKQFELAEIQLKNARSTLENTDSALESALISKAQAEASYAGARDNYRLAEQNYQDPVQLKQQLEAARTQLGISQANQKIALVNLNKVKKGARPEELLISQAGVKQARAALEQARLAREDTYIKSPSDGIVALLNNEEGEMVGPGTPILTIVDINQLYVVAGLSPDTVIKIAENDPARVKLLAFPEQRLEGEIKVISPIVDPVSKSFQIKVLIKNEEHLIKAGMFADLYLTTASATNTLVIPTAAVLELDQAPHVYLVENNRAVRKDLVIGIINGEEVEVVSGLNQNDRIIIKGQKLIKEQDPVEVIN